MSNRLNGKVAVITGGAKGLGLSIAEKFYEEGCQIIICDILSSEANKVAKNLKGKSFGLDVSDSKQVLDVFNDINNLYNLSRCISFCISLFDDCFNIFSN